VIIGSFNVTSPYNVTDKYDGFEMLKTFIANGNMKQLGQMPNKHNFKKTFFCGPPSM